MYILLSHRVSAGEQRYSVEFPKLATESVLAARLPAVTRAVYRSLWYVTPAMSKCRERIVIG
jgi:hypothetical protein